MSARLDSPAAAGAGAEAPERAGVILRLRGITKRFPGVLALDGVDLDVRYAEVHGLLGENGAGKSTLIKILTGAIHPDAGEIEFDGKPLRHLTPRSAMDAGIACIYQELNLIPHLTVAENIFLGRELRAVKGTILTHPSAMVDAARELLDDLQLHFDPRMKVGRLGIGHQQMVEIVKAVNASARLLIMDEPTASLSARETDDLFRIVARLRAKGVTMLFISHHLDEAKLICGTSTVLRDGRKVADLEMAAASIDDIIREMVGRSIVDQYPKVEVPRGEVALSVEHLSRDGVLRDISFELRRGEVLGLAGLVGSGRTELARAVMAPTPSTPAR